MEAAATPGTRARRPGLALRRKGGRPWGGATVTAGRDPGRVATPSSGGCPGSDRPLALLCLLLHFPIWPRPFRAALPRKTSRPVLVHSHAAFNVACCTHHLPVSVSPSTATHHWSAILPVSQSTAGAGLGAAGLYFSILWEVETWQKL